MTRRDYNFVEFGTLNNLFLSILDRVDDILLFPVYYLRIVLSQPTLSNKLFSVKETNMKCYLPKPTFWNLKHSKSLIFAKLLLTVYYLLFHCHRSINGPKPYWNTRFWCQLSIVYFNEIIIHWYYAVAPKYQWDDRRMEKGKCLSHEIVDFWNFLNFL